MRSLRDSLAADMVVLVSENTDYCGYATLWYSYSGSSTNWDAYAAVNSGCLSNQVLAHEVGHMQQLDHNRENATGMAAYAYSYGYRLCSSGGFVDIMSYPCSTGVPKINYFSNPNITYNGYPTGISYEANPGNSAETARTLNNTAAQVANYRVGSGTVAPTPPAAPSGLAVQGATYNSVSIGWNDNSTNESGFKVERSTDGVNFGEIASLGADSRSFTDNTVAALSPYYYRVRALQQRRCLGLLGRSWRNDAERAAAGTSCATGTDGRHGPRQCRWHRFGLLERRFDERDQLRGTPGQVGFAERHLGHRFRRGNGSGQRALVRGCHGCWHIPLHRSCHQFGRRVG